MNTIIEIPNKLLTYISAQDIVDAIDYSNAEESVYRAVEDDELGSIRQTGEIIVDDNATTSVAQYLLEIKVPDEFSKEVMTQDWQDAVTDLSLMITATAEKYKPSYSQLFENND